MKTKSPKQPKTFCCARCGEKTPWDEGRSVENPRNVYENFCENCETEEQNFCSISQEYIDPAQTSQFVLIKTEAAATMRGGYPPGIYRIKSRPFYTHGLIGGGWMDPEALTFVAPLPKPDKTYEISGHISRNEVIKNGWHKIWRQAYNLTKIYEVGKAAEKTLREKDPERAERDYDLKYNKMRFYLYHAEVAHTRETILANPNMLADLECDSTDRDEQGNHIPRANASHWEDIRDRLNLPNDASIPTYHEHIVFEHRGVKVFAAGYIGFDGWFTLHPEPRFRCNGHSGQAFSACQLPLYSPIRQRLNARYAIKARNWPWKRHKDTQETLLEEKQDPRKAQNRLHQLHLEATELSQPTEKSCYHTYESIIKTQTAKESLRLAIECGGLTQKGIAPHNSRIWKKTLRQLKARAKLATAADEKNRKITLQGVKNRIKRLSQRLQKTRKTAL